MEDWISKLYSDPEMFGMGHLERAEDLNLGLGWLYYALARIGRPSRAVVIGSYRGFAPMIIAKAIQDNLEPGNLTFIDPSMADPFWRDPAEVTRHFTSHGIYNIEHHLCTTEEFAETSAYRELENIGLLMIDGYHDVAHARLDFETFEPKLGPSALVLFHDSVRPFASTIYDREAPYVHDVHEYMRELRKREDLDMIDLPFGAGITLVRKREHPNHPAYFPSLGKSPIPFEVP